MSAVTTPGAPFRAKNPATGEPLEGEFFEASPGDIDAAARAAERAFEPYAALAPFRRAEFLRAIAQQILALGDRLLERAAAETGLPVGAAGERARADGQPGPALRAGHRGGLVGRGADRPRAAGPQAAGAAGHPTHAGPARSRGGLRRVELSARLLGRGRRHGVGVRGGLPGRRQGASRASRHVRARRRGDPHGGARDAHARGRLRHGAGALARGRHHARHASRDPRGRLHRVARGGTDALRRRGAAPRADPGLRRDGLRQSRLPPSRRHRRARRGDREGPRVVGDARGRAVLHESGPALRDRFARRERAA